MNIHETNICGFSFRVRVKLPKSETPIPVDRDLCRHQRVIRRNLLTHTILTLDTCIPCPRDNHRTSREDGLLKPTDTLAPVVLFGLHAEGTIAGTDWAKFFQTQYTSFKSFTFERSLYPPYIKCTSNHSSLPHLILPEKSRQMTSTSMGYRADTQPEKPTA